jgi:hypothetical protein
MYKFLKVIFGWIVIIPVSYIFAMWISATVPGGDGTPQLIIAGVFLITFMMWMFKVDLDEKLQKLLDQKEKQEKSTHE